jgi:hypothetical protein
MKEMETIVQMLPYMVPLIILEVVLVVVALVDLAKRKHVTGGNKIIWVLVAVCINIVGPIIYLIAGRKEEIDDSY